MKWINTAAEMKLQMRENVCVCVCVCERTCVCILHTRGIWKSVCSVRAGVCLRLVCVCVCMCASVSAADTVGVEASCLLMMAPLISWLLGLFWLWTLKGRALKRISQLAKVLVRLLAFAGMHMCVLVCVCVCVCVSVCLCVHICVWQCQY